MLTAEEMEPAGHVHVNAGRAVVQAASPPPIVAALAVLAGVLYHPVRVVTRSR